MSRVVKSAKQLAIESGLTGDSVLMNFAAAYGRLSTVIEVFLQFADDCNDLEQLKAYVKNGFASVTESCNWND